MNPLGFIAPPTLNGEHLNLLPDTLTYDIREGRSILLNNVGKGKLFKATWGSILETYPTKIFPKTVKTLSQVISAYSSITEAEIFLLEHIKHQENIEAVFWRMEYFGFDGNGISRDFYVPWKFAEQYTGIHPTIPDATLIETEVYINKVLQTVVYQNLATYDAGSPPANEVWILENGTFFKTNAILTVSDYLLIKFIPVFSMVASDIEDTKQLQSRLLTREGRLYSYVESW